MNFKYLSVYLVLGLALLMFTACEKENLDQTSNEEEEVITEVVNCANWQMAISHDGNGFLIPAMGGGTAPFTYLWSTGETTESITVTIAGAYTLTITDSEGCTVSADILVSFGDPCENLNLSIQQNPDGTMTAVPVGGTAPYSYLWSTGETTPSIGVYISGTYSVTLTDANGCVLSSSITINISDPCEGFLATVDEEDTGNGSSLLIASHIGGTAPYNYAWSTGASNSSTTVTESGTYSVAVTDANGCVTIADISVDITTIPCTDFSVIIAEQPPGSNDLFTSLSGGTAPYLYVWSTGETTATISVSGSGTYSVTVYDSLGCTAIDEIEI